MAQTDRHTDTQTKTQTVGHGDSMTNSAQWGRVGENSITTVKKVLLNIVNIKNM